MAGLKAVRPADEKIVVQGFFKFDNITSNAF